jgi:hypothetical protein
VRRPLATVAESLDAGRHSVRGDVVLLEVLEGHVDGPPAGRGIPTERAVQLDGLACHYRVLVMPYELTQTIERPAHLARARVNVGRRYIPVGADEGIERLKILLRQSLLLRKRQGFVVHRHPALASAERDVDHGCLEVHPERKGLDLVESDLRVKAHAALVRSAIVVELHPVGLDGHDAARVERQRDPERHRHVRRRHPSHEVLARIGTLEVHGRRGPRERRHGSFKWVHGRHLPGASSLRAVADTARNSCRCSRSPCLASPGPHAADYRTPPGPVNAKGAAPCH